MRYLALFLLILIISACKENRSQLILNDTKEPTQLFSIRNDKDTLITGSKGTLIKIQKNSFITNDGQSVNGLVQIQLQEFYTIEDFITNRLSTNTIDGRILISSGMIFIQATSDGDNLKIRDDQPITIMFKRVHDSRVVNLFSGEKGPFDEIRWRTLEPTYSDTIVLINETIIPLSYGIDSINVDAKILIGNDTIKLTDSNKEQFEKILNRYRTDSSLSYTYDLDRLYVFETTALGYINCDIFINDELYPFTVRLDNHMSDMYLVIDSLNSVLYPDSIIKNTSEYIFNIPENISISIVAYRKSKDKHFFKIERTKSNIQNISIQLTEAPLDKIRYEIKSLGRNAR